MRYLAVKYTDAVYEALGNDLECEIAAFVEEVVGRTEEMPQYVSYVGPYITHNAHVRLPGGASLVLRCDVYPAIDAYSVEVCLCGEMSLDLHRVEVEVPEYARRGRERVRDLPLNLGADYRARLRRAGELAETPGHHGAWRHSVAVPAYDLTVVGA